jgi:hypothetical protein
MDVDVAVGVQIERADHNIAVGNHEMAKVDNSDGLQMCKLGNKI